MSGQDSVKSAQDLTVTLDDVVYQVVPPRLRDRQLTDAQLKLADGALIEPMSLSVVAATDNGATTLTYRWYVAERLVTLTVQGYPVAGRHSHKGAYLLDADCETSVPGGMGAHTALEVVGCRRRPRAAVGQHHTAGLAADVAAVRRLQRQAVQLLEQP